MGSLLKRVLLSMALGLSTHLTPATIIFDMSGVLLKTSTSKASVHIGRTLFFSYLMRLNSPATITDKLFDFLDTLKPRASYTPLACHGHRIMPQLMCDWQCGLCSAKQLRETVKIGLELSSYPFASTLEKKLITRIADFMFSPEKLINAFEPINAGISLVRTCREQCDSRGERKHRLIMLSNFDGETFELMKKDARFAEMLSLFDDVIISGHEHIMKPDIRIFLKLFSKYDIHPDHDLCVFIDDQPENIESFNSCGKQTNGILCKRFNFNPIRQELHALGII